ncbi:MAG: TfoX/Sxy family protein [Saprospiraceae bacterium]|nr:TfoX/Sxy family protein [Saprospiraceae bacterium]HMX89549.1 TfoX/Sxy family protein [Saprospiraceae bacterium]HMZ39777.1 TfoX/Sxy family protein [Saprospiraceae bacterium]HNA64316.1 TfoX/Sxy family protein [Saprospiraceae bacterium]HNB31907.1 TfoX/Sxy family protein [Saprospiraceae bacterium]
MAYSEELADKVFARLSEMNLLLEEKKMFGGVCYMINDKMCLGIVGDQLMVRFDPELTEEVMSKPGAGPMDFTKKAMKGYAFIQPEGIRSMRELDDWIRLALEFNHKAKSSKKKSKW